MPPTGEISAFGLAVAEIEGMSQQMEAYFLTTALPFTEKQKEKEGRRDEEREAEIGVGW